MVMAPLLEVSGPDRQPSRRRQDPPPRRPRRWRRPAHGSSCQKPCRRASATSGSRGGTACFATCSVSLQDASRNASSFGPDEAAGNDGGGVSAQLPTWECAHIGRMAQLPGACRPPAPGMFRRAGQGQCHCGSDPYRSSPPRSPSRRLGPRPRWQRRPTHDWDRATAAGPHCPCPAIRSRQPAQAEGRAPSGGGGPALPP